ncbi:hypothetical protein M885DRAFT_281796 [Pelagophyceae sp. CCMP2097]|nr:hypothetical protein M885DRAFT_281796 [Pelagophyceae sp. CCMP2097]
MVGYWGHTARQVPSEPRERRPRPKPPPNGPATTGPGRSRSAPSLYEGLVVEERRRAANDRGRRLGDDEEAALLESALRESLAEGPQSPPAPIELPKPAPARADDSDDDDAGDAPSTEFVLADERRIEQTSLLLALPLEVAAKCLAFATVEGAMRGAAACRDWSRACWDASLCEALARRVWQSRSAFRPEAWGGWRGMLARRSRLRVSGAYSMRQTRSKLVKQDMFTATELKGTCVARERASTSKEMPCRHSSRFWVEVAWSRYFRFFENGAVLYSLQNEDGSPGSVSRGLRKG